MSGELYRQKRITRADVQSQRGTIFVFGDNLENRGFGGQAKEMRGEPNAVGVPTKRSPRMTDDAFFTDRDFPSVKLLIDQIFDSLRVDLRLGRDVVIPADGLGTGLADLPQRAPRIYRYIEDKIAALAAAR